MLDALKISPQSQVLPFTKSSLQFDRISPATPRAIYFNDDVAVGSVHPGGLIEIIANDRRGGIVFYTLDNNAPGTPRLQEESTRCVSCHGLVNNVTPGWIVANITAIADGTPQIINPAYPFDFTDQTRPFEDRWGGWYVTGNRRTCAIWAISPRPIPTSHSNCRRKAAIPWPACRDALIPPIR